MKYDVKFARVTHFLQVHGVPFVREEKGIRFMVDGNKYLILYSNGKFEVYRNGEFIGFAKTQHTVLALIQKYEEYFNVGKSEPVYGEERTITFTIRIPQKWLKIITAKARELNYSTRSSFIRDLIRRGAKELGIKLE